jgi:hypothetical protein
MHSALDAMISEVDKLGDTFSRSTRRDLNQRVNRLQHLWPVRLRDRKIVSPLVARIRAARRRVKLAARNRANT